VLVLLFLFVLFDSERFTVNCTSVLLIDASKNNVTTYESVTTYKRPFMFLSRKFLLCIITTVSAIYFSSYFEFAPFGLCFQVQMTSYMLTTTCTWASEEFFPGGRPVGDFPKIFSRVGSKVVEIWFLPLEIEKTTFFVNKIKILGVLPPLSDAHVHAT